MIKRPIPWLNASEDNKQEIFAELRNNNIALTDASLIDCAYASKGYVSICAVQALGFISSSSQTVAKLKKLVSGRNEDLSIASLYVIGQIAGTEESEYYAQLIRDPKYNDKIIPASILWELNDGGYVYEMRLLADEIIQGKIKDIQWENDPLYVSEYLEAYSRDPGDIKRVNELNKLYRKAAWSVLDYIKRGLFAKRR